MRAVAQTKAIEAEGIGILAGLTISAFPNFVRTPYKGRPPEAAAFLDRALVWSASKKVDEIQVYEGQLPRVLDYLIRDRRLPAPMIHSLAASGSRYADSRGNAVFLLLGKEMTPVGAELRAATHWSWRGMAPGSRKDLGFFSLPVPTPRSVVPCESAIDAISCAALGHQRLCISTSGARPNPTWLAPLIAQHDSLYCGFDSDLTGDAVAAATIALCPKLQRLRPTLHDWNDMLRSLPPRLSPSSPDCLPAS